VAAAGPNRFVGSSSGLATYDGTHFTSASVITLGQRYASAYRAFVREPVLFQSLAVDSGLSAVFIEE
jgi:hypothetical protein